MMSDATFHLLAAALFLYVAVECSIVCWIASYFEKYLEVSKELAAKRLRDFWIGLIVGRTLTLALPRAWTLWPAAIVAAVGLTVGCALLSLSWSVSSAIVLVIVAGAAAGPFWPVLVVISQHVRRSSRYTAAVIGAGAFGAAMGPLMAALVIRYLGLGRLFPVLTAGSLLLVVMILLARRYTTARASEAK